jgi:hypothetical protein
MDENEQPIIFERVDNRKGFLALPFNEEQFKEFLIGLLGKPQKIERIIQGSFEIHLSEVQNFHYLIEQRINQQNDGKLIQFRAKIIFDDKSSVELNSFAELETYNEIRPIISIGIELSWDYLILFKDKKIPEKQTINIGIHTGRRFSINILSFGDDFDFEEAIFDIEIQHTARTWAADMEAMLANHINSLMREPSKTRKFVKKNEGTITFLIGVLFFLMAVIGSFWATNIFITSQLSTIGNSILKQPDVSEKINLLATHIISGNESQFYFKILLFLVSSLFFSIIFAVWVNSNIVSPSHSFILLTKKAVEKREETLRREDTKWNGFILSTITSIVIGLISNYIFILLVH